MSLTFSKVQLTKPAGEFLLLVTSFLKFSACIPLSLSACSSDLSNSSEAPLIQGATDKEMFRAFASRIDEGHQKIRVRSYGGEEAMAIKIAGLIQSNRIALTVDGYCTSSCAQYLAAAAKELHIKKNSLLSFHMNSYGLVAGGYVDESFENFALLKSNAIAAKKLYISAEKNPSLMTLATDASQLTCAIYENGELKGAASKYQVWVPNQKILSFHGFRISGVLPQSKDETALLTGLHLKPGTAFWYGSIMPKSRTKTLAACN